MTSDKGVVERLRPSAVVDETVGKAVRALRAEGFGMLAGSLNEWLVENNSLKSEAQARIETLERALAVIDPGAESFHRRMVAAEAEVVRLTEALTKARDAIMSPVNSLAIVDTVWMPMSDGLSSIETLHDFIDAALSLQGKRYPNFLATPKSKARAIKRLRIKGDHNDEA